MIAVALVTIALAMLLVRLGWSGARAAALAGWGLAGGALLVLAADAGAWGLATGAVVGISVALGLVLQSGWTAPAKLRRAVRTMPAITVPRRKRDLARRLAVFVLVVPVAFGAAQCFAFGAQALARGRGAADADSTVLALFLQPLIWAGLMAWQMTRTGPARMVAAPVGAAALGTLLWSMA